MSDEAALQVMLRSRNRMLDALWAALDAWDKPDAPARELLADLRRRGLIPSEPG